MGAEAIAMGESKSPSRSRSRGRSRSSSERKSRSRSRSPRRSRSRSRSRGRAGPKDTGGKRVKGIACKWHDRGFGFIKPNDGGEDVFCHVSGLQSGNCLREGDEVEFEVAWDERQNKYRATEVSGGIQDDYIQSGGGGGGGGGYR